MEEIYLSSLNDEQVELIKLIGLDNFLKICKYCGGENFYFPSLKSINVSDRNSKIKDEFNGKNLKKLSKKYNLGERQIRRILKS